MPIKWKTTEVETPDGKRKLIHWAKHDPKALMRALSVHVDSVGYTPPVSIHTFNKHRLAVRYFTPHNVEVPPEVLFDRLKQMADKKSAIVETPVALLSDGDAHHLVTIWKKKTAPLGAFLRGEDTATGLKVKAALSAIRQAAKLAALKISHGHLKPSNFVVDKNGNARLIDYTRLGQFPHDYEIEEGKHSIPHVFSQMIYPNGDAESTMARLKLRMRLGQEYERQLELTTERNKRRGIEPFETEKRK